MRNEKLSDFARLRKFGFVVGGCFILLGWLCARKGFAAAPLLLLAGLLLALFGWLKPEALGPVERGWMKLGQAIGKVTTPVFLGVLYYLMVTPYAFLVRLIAGDPLDQGLDKEAKSYWKPRKVEFEKISYERQF